MAVATASEQAGPGAKHNVQAARQAYYDKIAKFHLAPLWEVLRDLVTPEPKTQIQPAAWKFSEDRKSTRLNSSHSDRSRMPSSA